MNYDQKSAIAETEEAQQRKHLHDQLEALREKSMTEIEKNQKVVDEIKKSKIYEKQESIANQIKSVLVEMGKDSKC